eukprot:3249657-Prymnesium_polylepis.1
MAHHLQGTLRGVQMTLWDPPKSPFYWSTGSPNAVFFKVDLFGIFTSRCCKFPGLRHRSCPEADRLRRPSRGQNSSPPQTYILICRRLKVH